MTTRLRLVYFSLFCSLFVLYSCNSTRHLQGDFRTPPPPDYTNTDHWASLPSKADNADLVPVATLSNRQAEAAVDVFFVHPTSYTKGDFWNADVNDKKVNKKTDVGAIKYQLSVFNGSCRIFAPRYRQAAYAAFFADPTKDPNVDKAFELAYTDVKTAFDYYMQHYNKGRPIIIASHSQGTVHATKLVEQYFDNPLKRNQLVAAYLVGMPIREQELTVIKPCEYAHETACYVTWNTFANKKNIPDFWKGAVTTNPLNWTLDGTYAPHSENKGALLPGFNKLSPGIADAQAKEGILCISKKKLPGKILFLTKKNFHIGDYNLFWMNIRENIAQRVEAYFAKFIKE